MRNTLVLLALFALTLLPLTGCASSPTIRTDYDTTISFDGWKTWAWAQQNTNVGVGAVSASLYDSRIRRSVASALAARGFVEGPAEDADFLVTYTVRITSESDVVVWDDPHSRYRWRGAWRPRDVSVHRYEVGSLILDVVQRRSGNIAWRGWAEAEVQRKISPEERDQRIDKAVHDIFARFPPQ